MRARVLVVEDESTLSATLQYNLQQEGYEVTIAPDGESALTAASENQPDLIVLDLLLPGLSGLEVCRILRREMTVPILMLTAKTGEMDKVVGLELGADDYVTKPFSMRELMARVRALLRRTTRPTVLAKEIIESGDLRIDLRARQAFRSDRPLALTPKEFGLLELLLQHRGHAFIREDLLNRVWGYEFAADTRTVDVHVRWLRQRIEDNPARPTRLITVRGVGYRFDR
jgi:DNA-binding response OmpR family regulator